MLRKKTPLSESNSPGSIHCGATLFSRRRHRITPAWVWISARTLCFPPILNSWSATPRLIMSLRYSNSWEIIQGNSAPLDRQTLWVVRCCKYRESKLSMTKDCRQTGKDTSTSMFSGKCRHRACDCCSCCRWRQLLEGENPTLSPRRESSLYNNLYSTTIVADGI